MRFLALAAALAALCTACSDDSSDPADPPIDPNLRLAPVVSGLDFPVFLTAPSSDARLFIVERGGRIRIVKDGELLATPFLDVGSLISSSGEQGLLCLAFDKDYAQSGRFFISYTNQDGDLVVASYHVSSDPDVADAGSATERLRVPHPHDTHYSGNLAFGPDGYLYVGMGDGGAPGEISTSGQDRSDLLASILRLDVSGAGGYVVPSDNPFMGAAGVRPELWSYGLRNPWRFSFDRTTGDLYIGDVGEDHFEEVDVATHADGGGRGLNFGWQVVEGPDCREGGDCDRTGFTDPVTYYSHDDGCSIIGGYVYRGRAMPGLAGTYFYADFCSGWVRSLRYTNGQLSAVMLRSSLDGGGHITSFGQDADGELYVLTSEGTVSQIAAATSAARASRTSRSVP